jgi:AraC-like DNA-binding protein
MRNNIRNMRSSSSLTALFPQVRQGVLAATLGQPHKWWYLSELADRLGTSPSSLQRELSSLVASGILMHCREGTRAYFKAETQSPVFRDLQRLFEKNRRPHCHLGAVTQALWEQDSVCLYIWFRGTKPGTRDE